MAVFLKGNPAKDRDTHWFGGPDFAVEIVSPSDRSRDKLDFYAKVGVRELLIVDRKPWKLELYRNDGSALALVGTCPVTKPKPLDSQVIPFRFTLAAAVPRPLRHRQHDRRHHDAVWIWNLPAQTSHRLSVAPRIGERTECTESAAGA